MIGSPHVPRYSLDVVLRMKGARWPETPDRESAWSTRPAIIECSLDRSDRARGLPCQRKAYRLDSLRMKYFTNARKGYIDEEDFLETPIPVLWRSSAEPVIAQAARRRLILPAYLPIGQHWEGARAGDRIEAECGHRSGRRVFPGSIRLQEGEVLWTPSLQDLCGGGTKCYCLDIRNAFNSAY